MSIALNIGKNAKPKYPGFCMAHTRVFGFGKHNVYHMATYMATYEHCVLVQGNPGL